MMVADFPRRHDHIIFACRLHVGLTDRPDGQMLGDMTLKGVDDALNTFSKFPHHERSHSILQGDKLSGCILKK